MSVVLNDADPLQFIQFQNNEFIVLCFYRFLRKLICNNMALESIDEPFGMKKQLLFNLKFLPQDTPTIPSYSDAFRHLKVLTEQPEALLEIVRNFATEFAQEYTTIETDIINEWEKINRQDVNYLIFGKCLNLCIRIISRNKLFSNKEKKELIKRANFLVEMRMIYKKDLFANLEKFYIEGLVHILVPMILYKAKNTYFLQSLVPDKLMTTLQNFTVLTVSLQNKSVTTEYKDFATRWSIFCLEKSSFILIRKEEESMQHIVNLEKIIKYFLCLQTKKIKPELDYKKLLPELQNYLENNPTDDLNDNDDIDSMNHDLHKVFFLATFLAVLKEILVNIDEYKPGTMSNLSSPVDLDFEKKVFEDLVLQKKFLQDEFSNYENSLTQGKETFSNNLDEINNSMNELKSDYIVKKNCTNAEEGTIGKKSKRKGRTVNRFLKLKEKSAALDLKQALEVVISSSPALTNPLSTTEDLKTESNIKLNTIDVVQTVEDKSKFENTTKDLVNTSEKKKECSDEYLIKLDPTEESINDIDLPALTTVQSATSEPLEATPINTLKTDTDTEEKTSNVGSFAKRNNKPLCSRSSNTHSRKSIGNQMKMENENILHHFTKGLNFSKNTMNDKTLAENQPPTGTSRSRVPFVKQDIDPLTQIFFPIVLHPLYTGPIGSGYHWWKIKQNQLDYEEQQKFIGDLHMIIDNLKFENACLHEQLNSQIFM